MNKLGLTPLEREHKLLTRALATDNAGNEILIGLTHEESRWYLDTRDTYAGEPGNITMTTAACDARYQQYQALHTRHYMTQLHIVFAETEAARKQQRH